MNSIRNYNKSSLNSNYSSKIVRPNTEKFGKLMDLAEKHTLAQVIKGETFGEGSGPLRQNIVNRIAVVKKMAYSGQYSIEDRENAIKALESRMKRWKKYNKNLQDLDFDLNVNYAVEALKPLRGQALIDAVNGKNKAENNCRMDYDSVFGRKESLVSKVEAPPVIENSGVKMPDIYETKGFLRNLWSRVGDYVNDVKEGLKEKRLAFGSSYGKALNKLVVGASLVAILAGWGITAYKLYDVKKELNEIKSQQRIEIIEKAKKRFVPSIDVEQQKPIEIVAEVPEEKVQVAQAAVSDVKPVEQIEKPAEEKNGIKAKLKFNENNIKSVSVPGFEKNVNLYVQDGIVHGVVFTSNVAKRSYEEQARINSHPHAAGRTLSRTIPAKLENRVVEYRMRNNLGVDKEGYITKSWGLPAEFVAYSYVEQLASMIQKRKIPQTSAVSVPKPSETSKEKIGDKALGQARTYWREQINYYDKDGTANLKGAGNSLGKALTYVGGIGQRFIEGILFDTTSAVIKRDPNIFKRGIKKATLGSLQRAGESANETVHVIEQGATAGVNYSREGINKTIGKEVGTVKKVTDFAADNLQGGIKTVGDMGAAAIPFYENPLLAWYIFSGGDGVQRAAGMDYRRLINGDLTGLPLIYNFTTESNDPKITKSGFRNVVELGGSVLSAVNLNDRIKDERNAGRGDDDIVAEEKKIVGPGEEGFQGTPTQRYTINPTEPERHPFGDYTDQGNPPTPTTNPTSRYPLP